MNKTGYIYHPFYLQHHTEPHPENPGRVEAIHNKIQQDPIYPKLILSGPREALPEEIALNHDPAYVRAVREACAEGVRYLDADTVVSSASYKAALLSAGAGIAAVDLVLDGVCDNAFCAVRPPGHHAERDRAMGFCLFNNVAIAAHYARRKRGLNKVFIFDWDVHHGNGTQNSFYSAPDIYYSSVHQYPFYPGTGDSDETGSGDGLGATLNFPLRAYSGDKEYLALVENRLIPEMFRFKPDLIVLSAGFDAHEDDPLANMQVTTGCYGRMTDLILQAAGEICHGRVVSMLEGGYNHEALSDSVLLHVKRLLS
ncbi:MAG: histone deacetylase [Nitrospinae bacterium]|nr:histone deacetylase [Nitrospinota bacterium]